MLACHRQKYLLRHFFDGRLTLLQLISLFCWRPLSLKKIVWKFIKLIRFFFSKSFFSFALISKSFISTSFSWNFTENFFLLDDDWIAWDKDLNGVLIESWNMPEKCLVCTRSCAFLRVHTLHSDWWSFQSEQNTFYEKKLDPFQWVI